MENQKSTNRDIEISKNFIDLEKIFNDKNPKMAKLLPGFFISYLKRVIHQDELNAAIYRNRNKFGVDFLYAILADFGVIVKSIGIENLPESGRYIIASNHPLGGLDGMALMQEVSKRRKDFLFPVNDLLMNLPNLKELFIPVNKHGSNADNIKLFNQTFESEALLLYFPAGLVSRKQKGIILDLEWKKTFLTKAIQFKRDIIPVHIDGRNSDFFYTFANLRKNLRLKANIEMLYLVDEMYKQKDKTVTITFGKPIPYQTFDKQHSHTAWAAIIKQHVYALGRGEDFKIS